MDKLFDAGCVHAQVCPKGLNPGKAIAKIKQSIHSGVPH